MKRSDLHVGHVYAAWPWGAVSPQSRRREAPPYRVAVLDTVPWIATSSGKRGGLAYVPYPKARTPHKVPVAVIWLRQPDTGEPLVRYHEWRDRTYRGPVGLWPGLIEARLIDHEVGVLPGPLRRILRP